MFTCGLLWATISLLRFSNRPLRAGKDRPGDKLKTLQEPTPTSKVGEGKLRRLRDLQKLFNLGINIQKIK